MAIIQNERLHDVLHNSLWMSYSEVQPLLDTSTIPDRGSVAYISGFMERFVRSENLFTPDGFDTLTQKFVALRKKDKSFYNREVADFALFLSGMNPERLKKKGLVSFYSDTGTTSYSWLYTQSSFPTFQELGENFQLYGAVITNARDRYMRIEDDGSGGIRIVPVYEKMRFRGVQEPDGNLRKLN
ncbi:MAG TPA: hypothetical protein HA230_01145 [Candidatus Aenigmarchaeota archaeon]|nr:hypothetical protein [Candidatus Aenigmarchaeota archaeon]